MNFYLSQDRARSATRWLVVIYLLALILLVSVSSWVLLILLRLFGQFTLSSSNSIYSVSAADLPVLSAVALFVIAGALISSIIKARDLAKGGQVVALSLGGRKILANTDNLNERKALNVVEEMAIASGMPVPDVYLLEHESSINAFAAGLTPTDAVIGLTQGCIDKLSRSQLQGVVGHEFSHILNGDMRLNSRLIMLITGIEFVGLLGRLLSPSRRSGFRSSSRSRHSPALVVIGLILRLLGWFGVLFGRLIQASISRQREFLADASAVQFTRDSQAVADALKVIGGDYSGTKIKNSEAGTFSHLFFSQIFRSHFNFLFATHPPLEQRIRALQPNWDGDYLAPLASPKASVETAPQEQEAAEQRAQQLVETLTGVAVLSAGQSLQYQTPSESGRFAALIKRAQEPTEALTLVVAVMLLDSKDFEIAQLDTPLSEAGFERLRTSIQSWLFELKDLPLQDRLPLIERAMPALKELSFAQYQRFKMLLNAVIDLDQQASVYEQTVYRLVTRFLDVHFGLVKPYKTRFKKIEALQSEVQLLMSMLADYGHTQQSKAVIDQAYYAGLKACGLPQAPRPSLHNHTLYDFNRLADQLAHSSLQLKNQIMQGLLACVLYDGQVAEVERELILALAATMDAPIPRIKLQDA